MKQPILFLDIDGVLNKFTLEFDKPPDFERVTRFETKLMRSAIGLVNQLVEKHNALIVVSSTWRLHDKEFHTDPVLDDWDHMNFDVKGFLVKYGLLDRFHEDWYTPRPKRFGDLLHGRPRGQEIKEWLTDHTDTTCWVAIDDDKSGFMYDDYLRAHLARTQSLEGLTETEFAVADRILSTKA